MTKTIRLLIFKILLMAVVALERKAEDLLELANQALSEGDFDVAINHYQQGIAVLDEDDSILIALSLYTNLGTTFDSLGQEEEAIRQYQEAIFFLDREEEGLVEQSMIDEARGLAGQASFFLGMVYQNKEEPRKAANAYAYANELDPWHWAALGNLGALLHDEMNQHDDALFAYNKAYEILVQSDHEPTDPPEEPNIMLAELQYRIGLCINHDPSRRCTLTDDPSQSEVSCQELASHAFALATKLNPDHEPAKHMLATVTADATMKRASNDYVKSLFDDYANNFEHSLVDELGYDGFQRLRRGFDKAFPDKDPPMFDVVVDAGCGTGLVGEQFRNISKTLIGVDLSEAIIEEANRLRPTLYDETIADDITKVFRRRHPISLIVAADSYIYFGDLDPLFESMKHGLGEGSFVAFTLENVDAENEEALLHSKPDWRWQLTASGRFAHRREYVEAVGRKNSLQVRYYEPMDNFRREGKNGVRGHLFVMRKLSEAQHDGEVPDL